MCHSSHPLIRQSDDRSRQIRPSRWRVAFNRLRPSGIFDLISSDVIATGSRRLVISRVEYSSGRSSFTSVKETARVAYGEKKEITVPAREPSIYQTLDATDFLSLSSSSPSSFRPCSRLSPSPAADKFAEYRESSRF